MRLRASASTVASERRCVGVDRRRRESEGKAKIEGYMSVSDEEAHHRIQSTTRIIDIWDAMRGDVLTPAQNLTRDLLVKPSPPAGTPTATELANYTTAKAMWSKKNAQGLGLIQATISNVIWQKYKSLSTVKEVLDALETKFRAVGGHRPTSSWSIW